MGRATKTITLDGRFTMHRAGFIESSEPVASRVDELLEGFGRR